MITEEKETLVFNDIEIELTFKAIKNIHLSVHPPFGRVTLSAPTHINKEQLRVYLTTKLGWIRKEQKKIRAQEREPQYLFISGESHYLFGKRYLLKITGSTSRPKVLLHHSKIELVVPFGCSKTYREEKLYQWYRKQLRKVLQNIIELYLLFKYLRPKELKKQNINSFDACELPQIDKKIRKTVPMGHEIRKGKDFNYWWVDEYMQIVTDNVNQFIDQWNTRFSEDKPAMTIDREYIVELCKKIGTGEKMFYNSVGSLGGGNHFIEIGESANDGSHYLTIHSGSRNFGLKVCNYHAKKMVAAKFRPQEYHDEFKDITLNTIPTSDIPIKLAELNERYGVGQKELLLKGGDMYEYLVDMVIAQTYAEFNHRAMAHSIFVGLRDVEAVDMIHSKHNFTIRKTGSSEKVQFGLMKENE